MSEAGATGCAGCRECQECRECRECRGWLRPEGPEIRSARTTPRSRPELTPTERTHGHGCLSFPSDERSAFPLAAAGRPGRLPPSREPANNTYRAARPGPQAQRCPGAGARTPAQGQRRASPPARPAPPQATDPGQKPNPPRASRSLGKKRTPGPWVRFLGVRRFPDDLARAPGHFGVVFTTPGCPRCPRPGRQTALDVRNAGNAGGGRGGE